jgi:DNA polymerase-3 subunit beta
LEEGEICVNGKLFTDFIGKISGREITLSLEDNVLEIVYDDSKSYLQTLPAKDFPESKKDEEEKYFEVKECDFKNLILKTVFCCATDEARPILKGCLIEVVNGRMYASALDGFRMAVFECDAQGGDNAKIVCPARTLTEIARMMEGDDKIIKVNFSKNTLSVNVEDTALTSRLYMGEFVKKENIFPESFTTKVAVRRAEMMESVERASVLIRGDKNNLITFEIKPGKITITANSDMGKVEEIVKADLEGKELKIAMNGKFLLDALKALSDETIVLSFNTPVSPFTLQNENGGRNEYLILPVKA